MQDSVMLAAVRSLQDEAAAARRQCDDLLAANNGYLERARRAEAELQVSRRGGVSTDPRTVMRQQGQHVGAGFAEVCAACGRPVGEVFRPIPSSDYLLPEPGVARAALAEEVWGVDSEEIVTARVGEVGCGMTCTPASAREALRAMIDVIFSESDPATQTMRDAGGRGG